LLRSARRGAVELLSVQNDKVNSRLGINTSFAEDALLNQWTANPFLARAASDSEVWFLSRSKFNALLAEWPSMVRKLEKLANRATQSTRKNSISMSPGEISSMMSELSIKGSWTLHPEGRFNKFWKILLVLVITYNMSVIPFRCGFLYDNEAYKTLSTTWLVLDYLGDTVLLLDIIINYFFLGFTENDALVTTKAAISRNYKKNGNFKLHLLASFPLEALLLIPNFTYGEEYVVSFFQVFSMLRGNKLLRVIEISTIINYLEKAALKAGLLVKKNLLRGE
tara:strand:+ start:511 stop:1350 length:840 start_codon:yes stop_codon:yes gene_type:complete